MKNLLINILECFLNVRAQQCFIIFLIFSKAITNVKTWALDREVFQNIMRRTAQARDEQYRNFLRR